ncbi:hypothetical protein [Polynucleobacter sp. UK-Kesae-W10]|uniref:hypothetical protein n=1 Tax=Polynucleobacter sp. UK-Kesae-W10 TaxID=1819738 RepID=UPI001C0E13B9|nr:hypothetical protein [Polynucleobacter sp. UK-Kesae-W10]MBU3577587.1 hypothetical protein [Polynucleobacter sp. UK-Kesae-W10]
MPSLSRIQTPALGNSGAELGFRNRIINGNFDVWQRATTGSGSGYFFVADRWLSYGYGGANTTFSQQAFTIGQTAVPNNPKYFARMVCTNTRPYLEQRLEGLGAYSGQQLTVSLWVKSPDITAPLTYAFYSYFGTSGSAPVSSGDIATGVSLSNTWQKVVFTYTVPSMTGKTIAGGNDYLGIDFAPASGIVGTLDVAQVQVEFGPSASPFDYRPYGTELALCQRYYYKVGPTGTDGFTQLAFANITSTTNHVAFLPCPPMRAAATSIDYANIGFVTQWGAGVTSISALTLQRNNPNGATLSATLSGALGSVGGVSIFLQNNNSGGYVALSAEL